jgi:hypothetical protein
MRIACLVLDSRGEGQRQRVSREGQRNNDGLNFKDDHLEELIERKLLGHQG